MTNIAIIVGAVPDGEVNRGFNQAFPIGFIEPPNLAGVPIMAIESTLGFNDDVRLIFENGVIHPGGDEITAEFLDAPVPAFVMHWSPTENWYFAQDQGNQLWIWMNQRVGQTIGVILTF